MTAYPRVIGWAVLLVVLLAATTVVVQAEDATDEQTLHEWIVTKIKEINDSTSSTATEISENGAKRAEIISLYTDYAKDSFTKATSGEKEPDSKALELLEKSKKMAIDKYQAAKRGSAESAEAAEKQYRIVSAKLLELTQQVKDKMANNNQVLDGYGGEGLSCQSCNDCDGALICCRAPDQQGSGYCNPLNTCPYGEGYCPPP